MATEYDPPPIGNEVSERYRLTPISSNLVPRSSTVTINGIPSNGSYVIVGSGNVETQTMNPVQDLPPSVRSNSATGSGSGSGTNGGNNGGSGSGPSSASSLSGGAIAGIVAAVIVVAAVIGVLAVFGTILGFFIVRRRRAAAQRHPSGALLTNESGIEGTEATASFRHSDSASLAPLQRNDMTQWSQSRDNLMSPYPSGTSSAEFDPYDLRHQNASAVGLTR